MATHHGTYNRQIFADMVRANPFGGSITNSQWEGMEANLDYIDWLSWYPVDADTQYFNYWNAYSFATDFHETARTMQPIEEYGSESYLKSKPYYPYYGRGKVQMTWEDNYRRSDREIAEGNLISPATLEKYGGTINQHGNPDQALNMEVACCNLMIGCWKGWWTGKKYWDYLRNDRKDYINARRIVNGTDRASQIAGYAEAFEDALLASWQDAPVEVPPPNRPPAMPEPGEPEPEPIEGVPEHIAKLFADTGAHQIREQHGEKHVLIWNRPSD